MTHQRVGLRLANLGKKVKKFPSNMSAGAWKTRGIGTPRGWREGALGSVEFWHHFGPSSAPDSWSSVDHKPD